MVCCFLWLWGYSLRPNTSVPFHAYTFTKAGRGWTPFDDIKLFHRNFFFSWSSIRLRSSKLIGAFAICWEHFMTYMNTKWKGNSNGCGCGCGNVAWLRLLRTFIKMSKTVSICYRMIRFHIRSQRFTQTYSTLPVVHDDRKEDKHTHIHQNMMTTLDMAAAVMTTTTRK